MLDIRINSDEKMLLKIKGSYGLNPGLLVLTNKSLIFNELNLLGTKIKNDERYSLSSISMLNGEPRIEVGYKESRSSYVLIVYMQNKKKEFVFSNNTSRHEAIECRNMIYSLITGKEPPQEEFGFNDVKQFVISSGKAIGEAAASFVGNYKKKVNDILNPKQHVLKTVKCPHCGATITGYKEESIKCRYCDSMVIIND